MTAVPDHDTHDLFDVFFFGCTMGQFRWVHQMLDQPFVQMFGREHRRLMHDEKAIQWAEARYGVVVAMVVRGHIALDTAVTSMKKRGIITDRVQHPER